MIDGTKGKFRRFLELLAKRDKVQSRKMTNDLSIEQFVFFSSLSDGFTIRDLVFLFYPIVLCTIFINFPRHSEIFTRDFPKKKLKLKRSPPTFHQFDFHKRTKQAGERGKTREKTEEGFLVTVTLGRVFLKHQNDTQSHF